MGKTAVRRLTMSAGAALAAIALTAGPASAHFCYNTKNSEQGATGKAGSANWVTLGGLAAENGICPVGAEVLADAAGVSVDTPIHMHATMAAGTLKKADGGGNPAISHLDFAAIEAAIPAAVAACEG